MHSLYIPSGPLAAFQHIGEMSMRRIQSTMSGPNQLGIWLLLPLSFTLLRVVHCEFAGGWLKKLFSDLLKSGERKRCLSVLYCTLFFFALFFTFSRSAWIACGVILLIILLHHVAVQQYRRALVRLSGLIALLFALSVFLFPEVVLRLPSTQEHFHRPVEALQRIALQPRGYGLGTAGPASNRVSDACVYLPEDGDASWAEAHASLCVFLGEKQVQPTQYECSCPFLPENWYLQLGVEMGALGMVLFLLLLAFVFVKLASAAKNHLFAEGVYLALIGVSIAALFLHAWEDSGIAYSLWILIAVVFAAQKKKEES